MLEIKYISLAAVQSRKSDSVTNLKHSAASLCGENVSLDFYRERENVI